MFCTHQGVLTWPTPIETEVKWYSLVDIHGVESGSILVKHRWLSFHNDCCDSHLPSPLQHFIFLYSRKRNCCSLLSGGWAGSGYRLMSEPSRTERLRENLGIFLPSTCPRSFHAQHASHTCFSKAAAFTVEKSHGDFTTYVIKKGLLEI